MKICDANTELLALRSLCSNSAKVRSKLLKFLNPSFFHLEETGQAYSRLVALLRNGNTVKFSSLLIDPTLSDETKEFLEGARKFKTAKLGEEIKNLKRTLEFYRQLRVIYETNKAINNEAKQNVLDINKAKQLYEDALVRLKSSSATENLVHIGNNSNSKKLVKKILFSKNKPYIPTGFSAFDAQCKGIIRSSLWTIGASTGGGKSATSNQLLINTYKAGYNAALVSLEMGKEECMCRILSNISRIPYNKVNLNLLSDADRQKVLKAFNRFNKIGKVKNNRYTLYAPKDLVDIGRVLDILQHQGYDIVVIDYLGLLDFKGEEWREFGVIAKMCKHFAEATNSVVVLVVQINEDNKVKYSRAVEHHSDYIWMWDYGSEQEETHILDIYQTKARKTKRLKFQLLENFECMQVGDCAPESNTTTSSGKRKKKRQEMVGLDYIEEDLDEV